MALVFVRLSFCAQHTPAAASLTACLFGFSSFCIPSYSACLCGEGLPHAAISSGIVAFFRFVLHSDPRFSPLESLGPCPLLSRRAGWRGPFFLFVFGASSLLVCFSWLVVRHDSIAYRHSDGTSIFRVVSSCFAGTDAVHPYTATSRVRFIRGPVVTRKRRGVGRQRVIARSDYLTQTEYLEETVLRAEARSCAGRRSCSHPWDGTQLCRQAQLLSSMGWPSVFIHVAVPE